METAVEVSGSRLAEVDDVLTPQAKQFVATLHRRFEPERRQLLREREERQVEFDAGRLPGFLKETEGVRRGDWLVAPAPDDLLDRRVEITGPVERKMMINALNSGAKVFMADFEDSLSPSWGNVIEGQRNLFDAVRRTISFQNPERGKWYQLQDRTATLVVRPRGWHLVEKHFIVDGEPISASLFDFGLYFFHNAAELLGRGSGPYFYLPKLEGHREAALWNSVFEAAQDMLGIPTGTIRATVLIETITAAFEMDEILHALRDHAAGLNAGRWDYIFSLIKKFANRADMVLPDRAQVTMGVPFMRAYAQLLVKTCHRRGAHAIGGMAAFIPSRKDAAVNETAFGKVREDKRREANQGFDGTWVAHPDLVAVAREEFEERLGDRPHQKSCLREDLEVGAEELVATYVPGGQVTEAGVRYNVSVALQYLNSWLNGNGAAAIFNLMEDAATAEISRAQLWQWIRHRVELEDGRQMTSSLYQTIRDEELAALGGLERARGRDAAKVLDSLVLSEEFIPFLTIRAYELLESSADPV